MTEDAHTAKAVEALASLYDWSKVGVIHQNTMWAREAASGFIRQLKADNPDATILNERSMEFTHSVNNTIDTNALLSQLEASGARIIFLAAEPSAMRDLFAAVYRQDRLYGVGYAWLLAGISDDTFRNEDGTVNTDAVHGAEGCLAFRERADTTTSTYTRYMQKWRARSSHAACGGNALHPYCDADGDPSTIASYSAFYADAVLLYAYAMHAIFRSSDQTASALYSAIKRLAPFEGVGGRLLLDPASADRLGTLELLNMQIDDRRRLAGFAASASRGSLVSVGTYTTSALNSSDTGGLTVTGSIVFPGGVAQPPSDTPPPISLIVPLITVPLSLLIICGLVFAVIKYRAWRRLKREQEEVQRQKAEATRHMEEANRQRHEAELQRAEADLQAREAKVAKLEAEEAKRELSKFKDAMVGVRAVITAYKPAAASERVALPTNNLYPDPDGSASAHRRVRPHQRAGASTKTCLLSFLMHRSRRSRSRCSSRRRRRRRRRDRVSVSRTTGRRIPSASRATIPPM